MKKDWTKARIKEDIKQAAFGVLITIGGNNDIMKVFKQNSLRLQETESV